MKRREKIIWLAFVIVAATSMSLCARYIIERDGQFW
jgi:hypothetical protein